MAPKALEIPGFKYTLEAAADLSASQYRAVKTNTSGEAAVITAITDKPVGILQDKPAAQGRAAELMADGISLMEAGSGGVTAGNTIGVDNAGKGISIAPGTATTQYLVGTALSTASAGDYFAVLFDLKNPSRAA